MKAMNKVERGIVSALLADASGLDVKALVENLNKAVHDFRAEHAKQLDEVKKGTADALQALKVDSINSKISELQAAVDQANIKMAGLEMGGKIEEQKNSEYIKLFSAMMRKGEINAALTKGSNPDGGFLAPVEWDRTITDKLVISSPMRAICGVQPISGTSYTKLYNMRGTASGWVGEVASRPETNTATFQPLQFDTGELYAKPKASQTVLEDAEVNLEQWLASEVDTEFAVQEGTAFLSGDGVNKPKGILTYVTGGARATDHPFGAIATVNSGAAAAITSDGIVDLIYSLPTERSANARFVMNRLTINAIRKLKDGQGNYLWQPSKQAGEPSTLDGFPITEMAGMPNIAASAKPILFGDFKMGYLIIDRRGVAVLRDPYSEKPFVQFYTTKRVGGGLANPEYLRALNISV
jgi:HK97 family phage major capsid protein